MPRHAFLNELSFGSPRVSTEQGRALFERLFRLLREINRQSDGLTIIGHRQLTELSIGNCPVGAWLRDARDRKRWLRALADRAPFEVDGQRIADEAGGAWEYRYREQVAEKLAALQGALFNWNGVGPPEWQIQVVPENERRHRYCEFQDLDGETRLFELHVRYAPGPNRIHFRLDAAAHRIVVAHVGRKLGI